MHTIRTILIYILIAVIVLVLGGVAGWYFFLHIPQQNSTAVDTARGLTPSGVTFAGGSTQGNISAIIDGSSGNTSATSSSPLWEIDRTPVAGMNFVTTKTATVLEYVERANGYVFAADPSQRSITRLTDTLMPKIYEALVAADGSVIERSLDDSGSITTFMATLGATTTASTSTTPKILTGSYIAKNIQRIVIHPTNRSVFYTIPNGAGGVDGITAQWDGTKQKKLFSSTIAHWTPLWLADGQLLMTENPTDNLSGYSYTIANDGLMGLFIGRVSGLTVLPHTSTKEYLYGSSSNGRLTLLVQSAASSTPMTLSIQTIADKCVWLKSKTSIAYCAVPTTPPSGDFLNAWYRGAVHTSDIWWKVDVSSGETTQIYAPEKSNNVQVDVKHPIIDESGNYIAFINATDDSLWMLKIPQ